MDLNFQQEESLRALLQLRPNTGQNDVQDLLKTIRKLADELKQNNHTLTISHKGKTMLTLGAAANAQLTKWITGTDAIEINDLSAITQLIK